MNRLPVAERREQLIEAALAVASRDGIDAATVRAVAAEAGVSLGVVHYCFQDKDELLRAMAHAITSANLERSLGELPAGGGRPRVRHRGRHRRPVGRHPRLPRPAAAELRADDVVAAARRAQPGRHRAVPRPVGRRRAGPRPAWSGPRTSAGRSRAAPSRARSSRSSTASRSPGSSTATAKRPAPGCRASAGSSPRSAVPTSLEARHRRDPRVSAPRRGASPAPPGARASPSRSGSPRQGFVLLMVLLSLDSFKTRYGVDDGADHPRRPRRAASPRPPAPFVADRVARPRGQPGRRSPRAWPGSA